MAKRLQQSQAAPAVLAPKPARKTERFEARIDLDEAGALAEILATFQGVGTPAAVSRLVLQKGIRCFWLDRGGEVPPFSKVVIARLAKL